VGLTETSPVATANPIGADFNGSVGLPIPSTDISIRDDAGQEVATNGVGEIAYSDRRSCAVIGICPARTEQVMLGDWLRTGDIGRIDAAGFVFIEDRKKDMILVVRLQRLSERSRKRRRPSIPGGWEVAAVAQPDQASARSSFYRP